MERLYKGLGTKKAELGLCFFSSKNYYYMV